MKEIRKIYLAGPMRGWPEDNSAQFHAFAAALRGKGFEVWNPAEHEPIHEAAKAAGRELETRDYMALDLPEVMRSDAVAVIPPFHASTGSLAEVTTAALCRIPVLDAITLIPLTFVQEREFGSFRLRWFMDPESKPLKGPAEVLS